MWSPEVSATAPADPEIMDGLERITEQGAQTPRYWIGVVSRAHVTRGAEAGFAQLCHGKERPLRRMRRGDWLVYYSPRTERQGGEPLQAFTAIGRVIDDEVTQHVVSDTFSPFRRAIEYLPCQEAPIRPLLGRLSFIADQVRWGFPFRVGHLEIGHADFRIIASAMGIDCDVELKVVDE